jgi:uncharacterized membrane protein YecN with MAPEG domain
MLPITLATASAFTLLCLILGLRVSQRRGKLNLNFGDGGDAEMTMRIRAHGNLIEYAPILLIVLALMELAGANKTVLASAAGLFVLLRIAHGIGTSKGVLVLRAIGSLGSYLMLLAAGVYGLMLAVPALQL